MKHKKIKVYIVIIIVFAIGIYFLQKNKKENVKNIKTKRVAENIPFKKEGKLFFLENNDTLAKINIEIAKTSREKEIGLMYRKNIGEKEGMLFIFSKMQYQSFWMKNTYISLDIIFITDDLKIESIQKHATPHSKSPLPSKGKAKYVLEVNAGFCDKYKIKENVKISFEKLLTQ